MLFELVRITHLLSHPCQRGKWALVRGDLVILDPLRPVVFRQPGGLLEFLAKHGFEDGYVLEREVMLPDALAENISELEFWQKSDPRDAAYSSRSLGYFLSANLASVLPGHLFRQLEEELKR
jgi:hypothetical protein